MKKIFLLFSIAALCSTNIEAMNNSEATSAAPHAHQQPVAGLPRPNLAAILVPLVAKDETPAAARKPHRVAQPVGNFQPRNLFQ